MPYSIAFLRKLCDNDAYFFTRIIGGAVNQGGDISPDLHKIVYDAIKLRKPKRHGKLYPRYWRKTTAHTVLGSIYDYLQNPEERQAIVSETLDLASSILQLIQKQLLFNPLLRKIYADKLSMVDDDWRMKNKWNETVIELPRAGIYRDPSFKAFGVTAAAQGGHFTRIRADDIIGKAAMESPAIMTKAFRWIDNMPELLAVPDRNHPDASVIDITGTHYAPGDAYVYIQETYKDEYEWYIIPALKDEKLTDTSNIRYIQNPKVRQGESNWPDKFPTEHYEEMRKSKDVIFWTQHMNRPEGASLLTKFDAAWLRYYHFWTDNTGKKWIVCEQDNGSDGEKFKLQDVMLYGMIDPAGFSEKKVITKGARSVWLIGGQPRESIKKFVLAIWAGRPKEPGTFIETIFAANEEWKPRLWKIDRVGNNIEADIRESARRNNKRITVSSLPVDVRKDSKETDIIALADPMHNGEIYVHRSMRDLINEIKSFPGGLTVDLIDMLAKLNKYYWTRRSRKDIEGMNRDYTDAELELLGRSRVTGY